MLIVIGIIAFLLSFLLTYGVRKYAISRGLQDEPTERSSHLILTPHGGGLAIVIAFIGSVLVGYYFDYFDFDIVFSIAFCGGLVAAVGFFDDHKPISVTIRIVIQFICAIIAIIILGGLPKISYGILFLILVI